MSTAILPLAVWASGTNQNSIPANDNALRIEALNREIISLAVTAQPASPTDGDTYIIASTHTGAMWSTFSPKDIAIYRGGTWYAWAPTEGLIVNVAGSEYKYDGGAWTSTGGSSGTVTSVDASGGVETVAGSAITSTGTIRASTLVNAQTGTTYTYVTGDRGKLVTHSNASAIAGTLPQATGTFPSGWFMRVRNKGAGTLTITPTTSTIDGAATLVLTTGQSALIVSDGTNYQVAFLASAGTFTGGTLTSALNEASPVTIASASTVNIGAAASNTVIVSGTTTITAFDTIAAGAIRRVRFSGALILTHNATTLILPAATNITTAAGDVGTFESLGSGNWRMVGYARQDGTALVSSGGGGLTGFTSSQNTSAPNTTVYANLLTATAAVASADIAIQPKANGSLYVGPVADNTSTGGNKRGTNAADFQFTRSVNTQVASGSQSALLGCATSAATGAYDVVIGGTSAIASGGRSVCLGGIGARSTGANSVAMGGANGNTSGGDSSFAGGDSSSSAGAQAIAFGYNNTASAAQSAAFGRQTTANGSYSLTHGNLSTARTTINVRAYAPGPGVLGNNQVREMPMLGATTSASATEATTDGASGFTTNRIILPTGSAFYISGKVVARQATTGDCASFDVVGLFKNIGGTVTAVGTPTFTKTFGDAGAAAWTPAFAISGTAVTVTNAGDASKTITWTHDLKTVEAVS